MIVITGGTDGIGRALVEECLLQGARVATCGRNADKLYQLQTQFPGAALFTQVADVSVENDCRLFIERTLETFGKIDVLINNAGIGAGSPIGPNSADEWHETIDATLQTSIAVTGASYDYATATLGATALTFGDVRVGGTRSTTLANTILAGGNALDIGRAAQESGVRDLRRSALMKAKAGLTSLAEINRVSKD